MTPLHQLCDAAAKMRGVSYDFMAKELTLLHAARAWEGFTGMVLRMRSHEALASWIPRVSSVYHDFGGISARVVAPGLVRGEGSGLPRFFVQQWARAALTFTEDILRRAGAALPASTRAPIPIV
jgi:hypothetical protein